MNAPDPLRLTRKCPVSQCPDCEWEVAAVRRWMADFAFEVHWKWTHDPEYRK